MGIANPRPAMRRREARNITANLRLHSILAKRYTVVGWSAETASERAMLDLKELSPAERKAILKAGV